MPIILLVKSAQFNQDCAGYLKQCSNANSIELALDRLNLAIQYLEENELTTGYTSILWKTENENIGFWYNNLKTCQTELEKAANSTQLEQTNILMRVRESLLENGDSGEHLIIPNGIIKYPNNLLNAISLWVSLGLILVGGVLVSTK